MKLQRHWIMIGRRVADCIPSFFLFLMEMMDTRNGVGLKYVGKLRALPRSSYTFLCSLDLCDQNLLSSRRNKGFGQINLAGQQNLRSYKWVEYFGLSSFWSRRGREIAKGLENIPRDVSNLPLLGRWIFWMAKITKREFPSILLHPPSIIVFMWGCNKKEILETILLSHFILFYFLCWYGTVNQPLNKSLLKN